MPCDELNKNFIDFVISRIVIEFFIRSKRKETDEHELCEAYLPMRFILHIEIDSFTGNRNKRKK